MEMSIIKRLLAKNKYRRDERRLGSEDRKILAYLRSLTTTASSAVTKKASRGQVGPS
jgi:hypothetical protein